MNRIIRYLGMAWFGYPGRLLLILAVASGVATGMWQCHKHWKEAAYVSADDLSAQLAELRESGTEIKAHVLIRHPQVVSIQKQLADGAIADGATISTPVWLLLHHWEWRDGNERYLLSIAPWSAREIRSHLGRHVLDNCIIALLLALILAALALRPLEDIREWLEALDEGRLSQAPPDCPWPISNFIAKLQVLGERLRHARSALKERQNASDRSNRATIRQLQQELAKLKQEQEGWTTVGDSRGELLRTMSHEMRTPLTAIMGYADLLGKNDPSPETGEYAGVISRSARNLLGMINNLLDLARIEAGALQPQINEFNVSELIEDTVSLLAPLAFDRSLELNTLIYHDVPPLLRGDSLRIAQVLTNLLSNAIKYTDEGEVIVRLLQEKRENDAVTLRLEVEDTGRGLDTDQQQKLFQAWRRFEVAGSKASGSGLGLAIVHKLLDVLGGDIRVNSTPGKGSVFSASIPCRLTNTTRKPARWDALRNLRVWVYESHHTTTRALSHLLTFWEVDFRVWDHPSELFDALRDKSKGASAQVLILGLDSGQTHASTLNDILSLGPSERPPAIAMLPSIDATAHQQWRERGAASVLAKGSTRSTLYDALSQIARPSSSSTENALEGLRVLVADNNPAGLRILKTQLQKLGATVNTAESGTEAMQLWEADRFGLGLLDYHMPGMNGLECAKHMRASPHNTDVPLLGMSAWLDPAEEEAWIRAGVDAVLVKPFDMERLLRALRQRHTIAHAPKPEDAASRALLEDPEMAALLRDELPRQWKELDDAFIAGELRPVRDAAHQLHGTAAFLHLQPLQNDLARLEKQLSASTNMDEEQLPELMARVQQNVRALLSELENA